MAVIKKVKVASRNADINNLTTRSMKEFARNDWSDDSYLAPILAELTRLNKDFTLALNRLEIYSQLAQKNETRNSAIRTLFHLVNGYSYIPIPEIKEPAELVTKVLNQYGLAIQKEGSSAKSAKITSLLIDLAQPDIAKAIDKLEGVAVSIAALTTAQEDFEKSALKQGEQGAIKSNLPSATTLKNKVLKLINGSLIEYMNVMSKANPEKFAATTYNIAQLVEQNNELVKRRTGKAPENVPEMGADADGV